MGKSSKMLGDLNFFVISPYFSCFSGNGGLVFAKLTLTEERFAIQSRNSEDR